MIKLEDIMLEAIERARYLRLIGKEEEAQMELDRVPQDMSDYEITEDMEVYYE
jgi:hypothetical protein